MTCKPHAENVMCQHTKFGATAEYALEDGGQDGDDEKVIGDSDISMARVGGGWRDGRV